jgi:hypothetical protein
VVVPGSGIVGIATGRRWGVDGRACVCVYDCCSRCSSNASSCVRLRVCCECRGLNSAAASLVCQRIRATKYFNWLTYGLRSERMACEEWGLTMVWMDNWAASS